MELGLAWGVIKRDRVLITEKVNLNHSFERADKGKGL